MPVHPIRNILLTYAWGLTNIGDAAITPGMLRYLRRQAPDARIKVLANNAKGSRYEQVKAYLEKEKLHTEFLPNPFGNLLDSDQTGMLYAASRFKEHSTRFFKEMYRMEPAVARAFLEADLIVFNSGMMLTYNNRGLPGMTKRLLGLWFPLMLAKQLGTPFALIGQSCGPLEWPGDELAKEYLPYATMITTRETTSLAFLQQLGIHVPHMDFGPDTTLYFERREDAWAEQFLAKHGLKSGRFLTTIIKTYGWWGAKIEGERLERHMSLIAAAMDAWVEKTGMPILLAPECAREIPRAEEALLPRLAPVTREKTVFMDHHWTAEQAKSVYAHTRLLMSMELHSILLALPEGIPVIHPYYDEMGPKTRFMRDAGFEDYLFHVDKAEPAELIDALLTAHDQRAELSERAKSATERMREAGYKNLARLWELLENR